MKHFGRIVLFILWFCTTLGFLFWSHSEDCETAIEWSNIIFQGHVYDVTMYIVYPFVFISGLLPTLVCGFLMILFGVLFVNSFTNKSVQTTIPHQYNNSNLNAVKSSTEHTYKEVQHIVRKVCPNCGFECKLSDSYCQRCGTILYKRGADGKV